MTAPRSSRRLVALLALLCCGAAASAQITTLGQWHMGEDDAGAASGNLVNSTLTAATGANLTFNGSGATYTNATPGAGSDLAVSFDGNGSYAIADNLGLAFNSAIEAWVNLSSVSATGWVVLVGGGSANGIGILLDQTSGKLTGAVSGSGPFAYATTSNTGEWHHVAVVVDNSGLASFYYDSALMAGTRQLLSFPSANFSIGGDENGNGLFDGSVDQVRAFTFNGTFTPAMFNYPGVSAIPEPSTYAAILGACALGFVAWRRRRRAA